MSDDTAQISPARGTQPWVFGYGSLIWRPGFDYCEKRLAHMNGWIRRFWQGSQDHRGTIANPGRVVTLIPATGDRCVGMAFRLNSDTRIKILADLDIREQNGYERIEAELELDSGEVVPGITYIATENNPAYLGDAPLLEMAQQIARCRGPSGSNRDYLVELAKSFRVLGIVDRHVFELESAVNQVAPLIDRNEDVP